MHLGIRTTADEQGYVDPLALLPTRATPDPAGPPATAPAPVQPAAAAPTPEATNPQPHAPPTVAAPARPVSRSRARRRRILQRACADSGTGSSGTSRREPGARSGVCRHPVLGGRRRSVRAGCPGGADAFVGAFVGGEARGIRTLPRLRGGRLSNRPACVHLRLGRAPRSRAARPERGAVPRQLLTSAPRSPWSRERDAGRPSPLPTPSHRRHAGPPPRGAYSYRRRQSRGRRSPLAGASAQALSPLGWSSCSAGVGDAPDAARARLSRLSRRL